MLYRLQRLAIVSLSYVQKSGSIYSVSPNSFFNPRTSCRKWWRRWRHSWGRRGWHCRPNSSNSHHSGQMVVIAPLIAAGRPFHASIMVANTKLLLLMIVALTGSRPRWWFPRRRWRRHCQWFSATIFATVNDSGISPF
jgi:hypothetical protein